MRCTLEYRDGRATPVGYDLVLEDGVGAGRVSPVSFLLELVDGHEHRRSIYLVHFGLPYCVVQVEDYELHDWGRRRGGGRRGGGEEGVVEG